MATEVYMDIPQVRKLVTNFKNFASILKNVNKVLEALSISLKITSLVLLWGHGSSSSFHRQD